MKCRAPKCKKEIVFVKTPDGKDMPVDANSLTAEDIMLLAQQVVLNYKPGVHVPHWVTCTDPQHFKKEK